MWSGDMEDALPTAGCAKHKLGRSELAAASKALLSWYVDSHRDLPWRATPPTPSTTAAGAEADIRGFVQRGVIRYSFGWSLVLNHEPGGRYSVWVSEVMLQQTRVSTVVDYYRRWMAAWPTLQALAAADLEEINKVWAGLGYYSRARRLHEGAKLVVAEYSGQLPRTAAGLQKLPGVGPYTAAAIASIAFHEAVGVVDGNVHRVLSRVGLIGAEIKTDAAAKAWVQLATGLVTARPVAFSPGDVNQALMELGACVCSPKAPACLLCPLRPHCRSANYAPKHGQHALPSKDCALCLPELTHTTTVASLLAQLPNKAKKKPPRRETVVTTVVVAQTGSTGGPVFGLIQRPPGGLLGGLWEFPSTIIAENGLDASASMAFAPLENVASLLGLGDDCERAHSQTCGAVTHVFSHIHHTYHIRCMHIQADGSGLLPQVSTTIPVRRYVNLQQFLPSHLTFEACAIMQCAFFSA